MTEPINLLAIAACRVAQATHAHIIGDEGEMYPLLPGARGGLAKASRRLPGE